MAQLVIALHSGGEHTLRVADDFDPSSPKPGADGWVEYLGENAVLRLHSTNIASVLFFRGAVVETP